MSSVEPSHFFKPSPAVNYDRQPHNIDERHFFTLGKVNYDSQAHDYNASHLPKNNQLHHLMLSHPQEQINVSTAPNDQIKALPGRVGLLKQKKPSSADSGQEMRGIFKYDVPKEDREKHKEPKKAQK